MEYLKEIIGFNSSVKKGKDEVYDFVVPLLKSFNPVKIESVREKYIFAVFGEEKRQGGIMLSGHLDVVPHEDENAFVLREDDENYYGRGTCDMKGFCVACLNFAKGLSGKKLKENVYLCFTLDEETGMTGAVALKDIIKSYKPDWAIVGEPTMMEIVSSHLGSLEGIIRVKGKAAHSSEPENGISAINTLIDIMNFIRSLPGIVNIGVIKGGTAHNILAEDAMLEYQIRLAKDDDKVLDAIEKFLKVLPKGKITHDYFMHPPLVKEENENLSTKKVLELLGKTEVKSVKYATEAGIYQSLGVTPVICGPGSIKQAHKIDEFCAKSQIDECMAMLDKLAKSLI